MFCLNDSMRYFLCPGSTDMRKGMFSLSGLIREKMNGDVRNGDVYIFINRLKNRIKLLHAETGGLVMYEKLLEEGTFKIPAYDPETHSYPMTWSDLVIMVEGINEDKRKGRQRRLSDLKRHWQISVNKQLAGLLFRLFFTTFIQSNRILNDNERRYAEAGDGPHAGTACLADGDEPEAK